MIALCLLSVAKKLPKQWENSPLHIKEGAVKALVTAACDDIYSSGYTSWNKFINTITYWKCMCCDFCFYLCYVRYNSGKIKCDISYEIEDVKEEEKKKNKNIKII